LAVPCWPAAVYPAAVLLALVLPFEAIQPVLVTPWVSLTDEKLVLLVAVLAWVALGARAAPSNAEWRAVLPSLTLLLVALVAALNAPEFGDEALHFVWRLAAAAFVLLLALRVASDHRRLTGLLWAIILGAGLSALVGLGEASGWPALNQMLSLFKVAPTQVAGELRVSASFEYATIAAMYFEMAAPLAIVLAARSTGSRSRLLALTIAALCTANVVLSLSRAGILTLGLVLAVLLATAWLKPQLRRIAVPALASAAVLVAGVAILAARSPVFDLRLVTESDADWYGAAYIAPTAVSLTSAEPATIAVDVRNEGRIVWSRLGNRPFALGYRWLTADGTGVLDVAPGEVALTRDVAPGETIHLQTLVQVPALPAGAYRLDWGMLQRDVLQFYERGWANAETSVTVSPGFFAVAAMPAVLARDDAEAPWVVGRLELWGAALRLIQTRPLLGVGPDNFRHLYGAQLGLETWDERVQANNLYLEVLADVGLLGLAAFLWVIGAPLLVAGRLLTARFARSLSRDNELSKREGFHTSGDNELSEREGFDTSRDEQFSERGNFDPGRGAAPRQKTDDLLTARFARSLSRDEQSSPQERSFTRVANGDRGATGRDEQFSERENFDPGRGAAQRRSANGRDMVVVLGLALAIVAFLVHGLLDSFLAFTPTALLLWMLLGIVMAQKPQVSGR
jgi:hypothetical protein